MQNFGQKEDGIISDTGNWNVAEIFARIKIMRPMENADLYEDIALYGFDSFFAELIDTNISTDELRIRGIIRLNNELIKLCKNVMFAMKKDKTEKDLKDLVKSLVTIRDEILPKIYKKIQDQNIGITTLKINESVFHRALEILIEIKSKINLPLNKNHLIFTDREEFDPSAFKQKLKDRIVNKG